MKKLAKVLTALIFIGWAGAASASLIGDTININHFVIGNNFSIFNQNVVVVDPGAEEINPSSITPFTLNVGANSVTLDYTGNTAIFFAQRIILSDLDWIGQPGFVTGVSAFANNPIIDASGLAFSTITSFTADSVTIDLIGSDPFGGQCTVGCFNNPLDIIGFNIQTSHSVPEAPIFALFGLGLAGLGWSRRKKV